MRIDQTRSREQGLYSLLSPQMFKAISDPNRIAILNHLANRCIPLTVGQIAEMLPVDTSVASRHLAILRNANILIARKRGREVHYSINTRSLISTLRAIADTLEACCPDECIINIETDTEAGRSCPEKNELRACCQEPGV